MHDKQHISHIDHPKGNLIDCTSSCPCLKAAQATGDTRPLSDAGVVAGGGVPFFLTGMRFRRG